MQRLSLLNKVLALTASRKMTAVRTGLAVALVLPLLMYFYQAISRPSVDQSAEQTVFEGVTHLKGRQLNNRPVSYHLLRIDLSKEGVKPVVSPACNTTPRRFCAQTTSTFAQKEGVAVAINANFFYPFEEESFWRYAPRKNAPVTPVGLVKSGGATLSPPQENFPSLCFLKGRALIGKNGACPKETENAVAGKTLLERTSVSRDITQNERPYPLTLAGLDTTGEMLFLLIVDGKQPFYSEGMPLSEGADVLFSHGANQVLELDGGGSATLVMAGENGPTVQNALIHTKIPGRERPVATHLGFHARRLTE